MSERINARLSQPLRTRETSDCRSLISLLSPREITDNPLSRRKFR